MNNNAAFLRNLIIYAICAPVAIIVGYWAVSAASAPTKLALALMGIVVLALTTPIFLRWHHPLMVFCWSLPVTLFFLPGTPSLGLPIIGISLGISLLQRATNRNMRFLHAPQITLPLCAIVAVAYVTAHFTGGIGLHSLGDQTMGGKKFVYLFAGVLGYFALTARRIPPEKANLYVALFFLPACVGVIGDLVGITPSWFDYIYLIIPPNGYVLQGESRYAGLGVASVAIFTFMLVRYGVRGCFLAGKPWRAIVLILAFCGIFFGGFRSFVGLAGLVFIVQFFIEGLHKTKLLPIFLFVGICVATACVPFTNKLPLSVQRAIAWLPVKIDPLTRADAQSSLDWRIEMWEELLPEVPQHLWLGKGYAITQEDWEVMSGAINFHITDPSEQGLALAGDYHNGPLSVILPLGIWGCIAVVWLFIAGIWALYRNYRYGDPQLKIINTALFVLFTTRVFYFLTVFGALSTDLLTFTGYLGLSICLNGGICRKIAPAPVATPPTPEPRAFPARPFQTAFSK
jgi:hypothetical protein